ncbi:adenosine deaminase [Frankia sp. AgKG'84/4]|nr:adenosine deaminase [Frankia sp. AgKG'84/4]
MLASQGVRYAEITITPWKHERRGVDPAVMFTGLDLGRRAAEREAGIQVRWVAEVPAAGPGLRAAAERTVELAVTLGRTAVVGLGLAVPGPGEPGPDLPDLADVFVAATEAGLGSYPHVSPHAGPKAVWDAVTHLRATRIGHACGALSEPALIDHLRQFDVAVEMCAEMPQRSRPMTHPLALAMAHRLAVCLGSGGLAQAPSSPRAAYLGALRVAGLRRADLVTLVETAISRAALPETGRAVLRGELATTVAEWGTTASTPPAQRVGGPGSALARRCRNSTVITGGSGYRAPGS